MSIDTAFARLRDANPVPEPARLRDRSQDLSALLAATRQRSMEMGTEIKPLDTYETPTPMWRKAMPALVAAAVAIVVGAAVLLLARNSEPDVAETPQGIAELLIEGDADTAVEVLATDAVVDHGAVTNAEEYAAFRDWQIAIGSLATVAECSETPTGPTVEVSCTYIHGNAWSEALGVGPFTVSRYDFVIVDGQIEEMRQTFDTSEFAPQAYQVFTGWLKENHPSDRTTMIRLRGGGGEAPILTPESIAVWEQYTNEFVAFVSESGTR